MMFNFQKIKMLLSCCAVLLLAQHALADVYGFQLTISAMNLQNRAEIQNGSIVTSDLIEGNNLSFTLTVIDPSDPKKVLKVDEWKTGVFSETGVKLSSLTLKDQSKTDNVYQAVLDSLGGAKLNGQTVIVKAQALIGDRTSNEVSFKVRVASATTQAVPTLKAQEGGSWIYYLLAAILLIFFFILFYKRRKKDEKGNEADEQVVEKF